MYYVNSYAVRVLAQCLVKRKTANKMKISCESNKNQQHRYILLLFSTSFRSANPNFGPRPKLGGQISLWTEQKTNPKSEVAQ